jgi:glyoxylase-like metal-dependent hydrolase (beta-lactamase superfamily II)
VTRVLAPNPGPFTLEGTNTWVVGEGPSLVIDPGPSDERHIEAVLREAAPVGTILLTHHHPDHAAGAATLAAASGAPVLAFKPEGRERPLAGGHRVEGGGIVLRPMRTPGHSRDHVIFHHPESGSMFTGDAVLGRGTSVVDPPQGDMADYVRSLVAMLSLAPRVLYPGHGPVVERAVDKLREYIDHRKMREGQVLWALGEVEAPRSPEELVPQIYSEYPPELHAAAARSVLAHLIKLEREGRVIRVGRAGGERFELHRDLSPAP